ncbi:hypothetical protein D3H65_22490 [Paraflavitalea soli]|uniref:Uncharacterized protein n=1 Tax=Paraflavitalea soli TaxID=2315862 RepID=A0A3B7MUC1_9BACT|nr:hypothetical protein [Paraflavitalea soli]AXY76596.1 hypothetical protein D3H65_22490 [Paraflavitalea soli]
MNYIDDMFGEFAEAFLGNMEGEGDIPSRHKLNVSSLDYSLDSLKEVDRYLEIIYKIGIGNSGQEYQNLVVWAGAYLGEVIRRNATAEYHWVQYEEYMRNKDANLKNLIPLMLTTHAFLVAIESDYMTMPLNKVARWLDEGTSNNLHYYAAGDIKRKRGDNNQEGAKTSNSKTKPWWKIW